MQIENPKEEADNQPPAQIELMNFIDIFLKNDCSDKASLKRVIKTDASNCTQLKTVLYMINMNGIVNSLLSYSDPYQQST